MADNSINGSIGLSADPGLALLEEEKSKDLWWEIVPEKKSKLESRRAQIARENSKDLWWEILPETKEFQKTFRGKDRNAPRQNEPVFTGGEGYRVYVDDLLLPVPPAKLELSIQNRNKTMDLVSGGQINLLKTPGLSEVKFTALLPNQPYHFAMYEGGYRNAHSYLDKLEALKVNRKSFPLRVLRMGPGGDLVMESTSLTVSLEAYSILEDAEQYGLDTAVDLTFRQYQPYGTKTYVLSGDTSATEVKQREVTLTTGQETYTLQEEDTLYTLSKKLYGTGDMQEAIYELNKDVIEEAAKKDGLESSSNGNVVYAGTVLKLPPKASEQAVATGQNPVGVSLASGGALTMKSGKVVTSGRVITVPSWVNQSGIAPNETYNDRGDWGSTQGTLYRIWKKQGKPFNGAIATISGYYLVAMTLKFGTTGDAMLIVLENGAVIPAIMGDSKGKNPSASGERGTDYGHMLGNQVDIVEWERYGGKKAALNSYLAQVGWKGQKVVKVINYGSWLNQ